MSEKKQYKSQAARDAEICGYGNAKYWEYLDAHCMRMGIYFAAKGDHAMADKMLTQSLSDAIRGNDGI